MADTTYFVNKASAAGGDGTTNATTGANRAYNELSDFESNRQQDLTSGGGGIEGIITCSVAPGAYTSRLDVDGWTTDATHYINVVAETAARHNGVSRDKSGAGGQIKVTGTDNPLLLREDNFRSNGLEWIGNTLGSIGLLNNPAGSSDVRLDDTLFVYTGTSDSTTPMLFNLRTTHTVKMTNCLTVGHARGGDLRNLDIIIDHCGLYCDGTHGFLPDSGATITNTWCMGGSSDDFWTGGTAPSGSNNASDDASAISDFPDSLINRTPSTEFTNPSFDPAVFDFTLKSGNTLANAGIGALAEDISDTARSGTRDIGPWEEISAGAPEEFLSRQYPQGAMRGVLRGVA